MFWKIEERTLEHDHKYVEILLKPNKIKIQLKGTSYNLDK